jgi:hypothetical protein
MFEPAMIDLAAKTVTFLPLPATDGFAHNVCLHEGKVLYCLKPKTEVGAAGIYVYDPANPGTGVTAPTIATSGTPVFLGAFED